MLSCFHETPGFSLLDRSPFAFEHRLMEHPAVSLENLARVIPALPAEQVFYSSGLLDVNDNFDRAHLDHRNGLSIEETIETLRTGNSYVMVRSPEVDPSFAELYASLISDVEVLIKRRRVGHKALDPMLYLFIASPNSLTPFHIDRYSTILMQFRGSKKVAVFPSWDQRVVPPDVCEQFMARTGVRPQWSPEAEALGQAFQFSPGEAIHIPFMAGHHVQNGADDVSISMSIIFNTRETQNQSNALIFNQRLRKLGVEPMAIGQRAWLDSGKGLAYRGVRWVSANLRRRRSA